MRCCTPPCLQQLLRQHARLYQLLVCRGSVFGRQQTAHSIYLALSLARWHVPRGSTQSCPGATIKSTVMCDKYVPKAHKIAADRTWMWYKYCSSQSFRSCALMRAPLSCEICLNRAMHSLRPLILLKLRTGFLESRRSARFGISTSALIADQSEMPLSARSSTFSEANAEPAGA